MRKESSGKVKPIKVPKKKIMARRPYRGKFDPDYVIKRLKKLAKRLRRFPMHREIAREPSLPYPQTIVRYFGSYHKVAEITGYPYVSHHYSDEELLNLLKLKTKELGRAPTKREIIKDHRMPDPFTYATHFGSWAKAVELIGYKAPKNIPYTLKDFKMALKKFYRKYHHSPTIEEFHKVKEFPSTGALGKFGKTWNQMLIDCGLPINKVNRYSLDDLKKAVKTFYRKHKRPPTVPEFRRSRGFASPGSLRRLGMTWSQLLTQCGLPVQCRTNGRLSANRVAEVFIKKKLIRIGHKVLDLTEQNFHSPYSLMLNNKIRLHVCSSQPQKRYEKSGEPVIGWTFQLPKRKEFDYIIGVGMSDSGKPQNIFVFPTKEITVDNINVPVYAYNKYSRYYVSNLKEVFPLKGKKRQR